MISIWRSQSRKARLFRGAAERNGCGYYKNLQGGKTFRVDGSCLSGFANDFKNALIHGTGDRQLR
jgi:hypothetical protein